jgi:hypothetical protein
MNPPRAEYSEGVRFPRSRLPLFCYFSKASYDTPSEQSNGRLHFLSTESVSAHPYMFAKFRFLSLSPFFTKCMLVRTRELIASSFLQATMSGQNGSFQIVAVNSNGRQLTDVTLPSAGFDVSFSLRGRALLTTKAVTAGNGGLFMVRYTLSIAGVYAVSVSTGGLVLPNPVEGTVGSSLQLTVWPGPPSKMTSLVTSVKSEYRAEEQVAVFVDARDVSNNSQVRIYAGFPTTL